MTTEIIITKEKHEVGSIVTAPISESEKFVRMGVFFIRGSAGEVESTKGKEFAHEAVFVREAAPVRK